jgi:hypothetical protein
MGWAWWNGIKKAKILTIQKDTHIIMARFPHTYKTVGSHFNHFPELTEFCGGLALISPWTSNMQFDFSFIGWEMDDYRFNFTDLSVEDILHVRENGVVAHVEDFLDILETKW